MKPKTHKRQKWTSQIALWKRWIKLWTILKNIPGNGIYDYLKAIKDPLMRQATAMLLTLAKWHPLRGEQRGGIGEDDCGLCQWAMLERSVKLPFEQMCKKCALYLETGYDCGEPCSLYRVSIGYSTNMSSGPSRREQQEATDEVFDAIMAQFAKLHKQILCVSKTPTDAQLIKTRKGQIIEVLERATCRTAFSAMTIHVLRTRLSKIPTAPWLDGGKLNYIENMAIRGLKKEADSNPPKTRFRYCGRGYWVRPKGSKKPTKK